MLKTPDEPYKLIGGFLFESLKDRLILADASIEDTENINY